jgi:RNA polymerase sigma-70 factor (ECF subfamily)
LKSRRLAARLVDLESIETAQTPIDGEAEANRPFSMGKLLALIQQLKPLDRQVMLLYLEGETAGSIADVTGLSSENVATKVDRMKTLLKQQYFEGAAHAGIREVE